LTLSPTSSRGASSSSDPFTHVTKLADQSIANSITLTDDAELFFTAVSGGVYQLEIVIVYASPAGAGTPDLRLTCGEDAVIRGVLNIIYLTSTDLNSSVSFLTDSTTTQVNAGTAATNRSLLLTGWHVGGGGTFRFRWAQTTTGANPTIVRAGSEIRYRRT
jgi:hypothetical protein